MRTKLAKITLAATLGFALTLTLSCSDSGGSGNGNPIKKDKISGVSQKGPFVEGSTATLYELDSDFNQTGRSFRDIIADNKGSFEIRGVELISPYAMLEASGYYRNEVTGNVSTAPITLFAIADIREKDNVNVNILTHLEYYRVLNLVEGGKSVAEAKKQAQKEILAVFGISGEFENSEAMTIFGTSEGDAALLAISVLLQGDLSEGEFSQRLTNFAQGIKENGAWNDEAVKTEMSDWAFEANLAGIRNAILEWGLSSEIPDFGKHVRFYYTESYGLGGCDAEGQVEIKKNDNENSKNEGFVCQYGVWQVVNEIEVCLENQNCSLLLDDRDGKAYIAVKIGEQTWMGENLNYSGDNGQLGLCFDNNPDNCKKYGRMYNFDDAKVICPKGWRLPNNEDWDKLELFIDDPRKLKAKKDWKDNFPGTDDYGFTALPGGANLVRHSGNVQFRIGYDAAWWIEWINNCPPECSSGKNYIQIVDSYILSSSAENSSSFSVRCIKD
jgi:uncharacterized protein (TIGR02145 family)